MSIDPTGIRTGTVRLATGPAIHYVEQGPRHSRPIVLVHGWPDSWYSFSRVLALLPPDQHAYALDLPGFGDSQRPPHGYTIDALAADVLAFCDAVGAWGVSLVGHSMGSFVVRRVAETHRTRVDRLVLIGSAVSARNPVTEEVHVILGTLSGEVSGEFAREFQAGTIHHPVPEEFFDRIVTESRKAPARVWRAAFEGLLAAEDAGELTDIASPTLVVWGEQDALFSRADQDQLAAAIPHARLITYPDTGHCPNWERPERMAADVTAFLAEED